MSALITWGPRIPTSAPLASNQNTKQGFMALLKTFFDDADLLDLWDWEVCSHEILAEPFHIALKPKSGATGRILFLSTGSTTPGQIYNPQLGNTVNWNAHGIRAAYFRGATTDVPANMFETTGVVFADSTAWSGLGRNITSYGVAGDVLTAWSSSAGIVVSHWTPNNNMSMLLVIGELMDDIQGNEQPVSGSIQSINSGPSTLGITGLSHYGYSTMIDGVQVTLGTPYIVNTNAHQYMRDNATKYTYYLPVVLGSFYAGADKVVGYKLRQIAYGPTTLANHEALYTSGPTLMAQATATESNPFFWLTNFKV